MSVPGVLSATDCEALGRRILGSLSDSTKAELKLSSIAEARAEFARGETHIAAHTAWLDASLDVDLAGRSSRVSSNQIDDAGIRTLAARAERAARENPATYHLAAVEPRQYPKGPPIFFDKTVAAMTGDAQAALVQRAIAAASRAGLVAAGTVVARVTARAVHNTSGMIGYDVATEGEFSLTARGDATHRGSGWAWSGYEDWGRVDPETVIRRAVDLGERSAHPVAVEPGRYLVILEPAAVAALLEQITHYWAEFAARAGRTVFSKEPLGTTKVGLQMMDRRLGMVSSPWDPDRPSSTIDPYWRAIPEAVVWFQGGVLRTLVHPEDETRKAVLDPGGVRLTAEGPTQTLEEMIASTKRGVWVNRLSHLTVMDERTLVLTGTTRDGTFLIENGKITKPIKNFRFTESPFFVFNQLEAWGEPVRASSQAVAPRLKLRDFNFTSLTDAI